MHLKHDHDHALRRFQRQFVMKALHPDVDTAVLSLPRGNGKSWLSAHILTRCLTPGDDLHVSGSEHLLCAGSIKQARLEPTGEYRWLDSAMRIGATHKRSTTRLRVLSSNAKTAFGIVGCPLLVADEPGSWEVVGGQLLFDALATSAGKPGSPMRTVYIGTLAPARAGPAARPAAALAVALAAVARLAPWRRARPLGASSPAPRLPGEGRGGCPGSPGVRRD